LGRYRGLRGKARLKRVLKSKIKSGKKKRAFKALLDKPHKNIIEEELPEQIEEFNLDDN
jgi:hypothetical protein